MRRRVSKVSSSIQFGALPIAGLAVGLVTPPVGKCPNVCSAISGLSVVDIFRGAISIANLLVLILISGFPALSPGCRPPDGLIAAPVVASVPLRRIARKGSANSH